MMRNVVGYFDRGEFGRVVQLLENVVVDCRRDLAGEDQLHNYRLMLFRLVRFDAGDVIILL